MSLDGGVDAYRRKQRREGIMMVLISLMFVVAGGFMWFVGGQPMGLVGMLFFGACLLAGVLVLTGGAENPDSLGMIATALLLGVGCGALALVMLVHPGAAPPGRSAGLGVVVGLVGAVFFGGGGIALLVRRLRRSGRA